MATSYVVKLMVKSVCFISALLNVIWEELLVCCVYVSNTAH